MNAPDLLSYLLDTNMVIYVVKRRPPEVREVFNSYHGRMAISSITLGELLHGVEKSSDPARNFRAVQDFTSRLQVLPYDEAGAAHYGQIRATLERQGQIIGVNDLHIAGHARSRGLTLVTNNEREFCRVEGLRVENWVTS
ncbi:ribonuclease VapC [Betaproteobacteria bacterium]|nr:ribonuclease VapC [Betaproteobacteria bacterium]GHU02403.1 ribonuclease VapC [Betaproteobacteria bacterium]GHU22116.1 ribonuclease VapC [Betaproteobacteria bacterium]